MFGNPYLMIASAGIQMIGKQQAASAERRRQNAIAAQHEQNAKFQALEALQQHNARQDRLQTMLSVNDTVMAVNNRGSNDRSLKALTRGEKKKSATDDGRARTQTLLEQSRTRFAAADARAAGNQAMRSAFTSNIGTLIGAVDKYQTITETV